MDIAFWQQPATLLRDLVPGAKWKGPRGPRKVSTGSLAEAASQIAAEDPEDIWRFTIVTGDGHHIRSAELRALMRRSDFPDARHRGADR